MYMSLSPFGMFVGKNCVNTPVSRNVPVCSSLCLQVTTAELLNAFQWHSIMGISNKILNYSNFIQEGAMTDTYLKVCVWSCMHLQWYAKNIWLCYGSGSLSLASYCRDPGSVPGQSMRQDFSKHFGFPVSSSSQNAQYSVMYHSMLCNLDTW
jgi:hypothetical protein